MAVVHCKEIVGRDGERDQQSNKRYVRVFQLLTSEPTDGAKLVLAHPDLPAYGDPWESYKAGVLVDTDLDARCVEKSATQSDGDNHQNWMVTCRYAGVGDPTLEPPKVSWTSEKWQETSQKDYTGRLFANSAGEPFENGLTVDHTRKMLIIERNQLTYDPVDVNSYEDTTNQLAFLAVRHPPGFAPDTCKIDSIDAVPVYYPNYPGTTAIHYWRVTYKISIDRRTWALSVIDMGLSELIAVGGTDELIPIIAKNGQPTTVQLPLDGAGLALVPGATPELLLPFQRYELKDWTPLGIDY